MGYKKGFNWGVSTSAFQSEGFPNSDGKSESIWDRFSSQKGKILDGSNAQYACQMYKEYEKDILFLKELEIPNFRTSISWSRVLPKGTGQINHKGLDYYKMMFEKALSNNITPWVTLYHWDLPQYLQDKGGWTNRDIIAWFNEYVYKISYELKDIVNNWIVLNEPMVFTGAGYFLGVHAPGSQGVKNFLPAVHHAVVCQGTGGKTLKEVSSHFNVGTTFSCSQVESWSSKKRDIKATNRVDALLNRLFIEPALGMGYPSESLPLIQRLEKWIEEDDMKSARFDFDFIGIQNYTREIVKYSLFTPYIHAKFIPPSKRNKKESAMGWEIYPQSVPNMLLYYSKYNLQNLIISENGISFEETDGDTEDQLRLNYLESVVKKLAEYSEKYQNLSGYFVWTLYDNFEWAEGYRPKFGIAKIQQNTRKRIAKSSAIWYSKWIKKNSF